jgi:ribosome maturation factor RimP
VAADPGLGNDQQAQERAQILAARAPSAAGKTARAAAAATQPRQPRADARGAIETTVTGLGYELVDVERALRGLLRVTIDRVPGQRYTTSATTGDDGDAVTVDDCELVTRQLQYALEVEGVPYERLEVSSPGLDRPLKTEAQFQRFAGAQVSLTLKQPFEGRKAFKGLLGRDAQGGWTLVFEDGKTQQVLGFGLDEVREARLVPVLDFKGRRGRKAQPAADAAPAAPQDGGQE